MSKMHLKSNTLRDYLNSHRMMASEHWIHGCVEFLNNHYISAESTQELCKIAKTQWILCNLSDISPGCLPPKMSDVMKMTLTGTYILQMNQIIDVGSPAYQQLQKLVKADTENLQVTNTNIAQEPPPQRMFKLTLTDGVQIIHGIEYKPMRNLNSNLTPGVKIEIKGPIDCRRGVLMMEENHINILGGEVEDLLDTNCYKNILCKKINVETANNFLPNNFTREPAQRVNNHVPLQRSTVISEHSTIEHMNRTNNIHPQTISNNIENDFNDDMFDNIDLQELDQVENEAILISQRVQPEPHYGIQLSDDVDEAILLEDEDDFKDHFVEPDVVTPEYPIKVSKKPYLYIKQLLEMHDDDKKDNKFLIKAQVLKVVGKLSLLRSQWILKCTVTDGSSKMDVDFVSDLLSELIEFTPEDTINLKKQMSTNPEAKITLMKALDSAMNKILRIDSILHLQYIDKNPNVVKIENVTEAHLDDLKERTCL